MYFENFKQHQCKNLDLCNATMKHFEMQFKVARYVKEPVNMWPLATVLSSLSIRQLPCFPHGLVGGKQDRA